jgi:hypothetical protein
MTADTPEQRGFDLRRFLFSGSGWPYLLVPFIPVAIVGGRGAGLRPASRRP